MKREFNKIETSTRQRGIAVTDPHIEPLLTAEDVAEIFRVKPRTVLEVWAKHPNFPKAIGGPGGVKGRAHRRWRAKDIQEYIDAQ